MGRFRCFRSAFGIALLLCVVGCSCGVDISPSRGILATDLASKVLSFQGQPGAIVRKSLRLYNSGPSALTLTAVALPNAKTHGFRLVSLPKFPLLLVPGKDQGIVLTIESNWSQPKASLTSLHIISPDAKNTDEKGRFSIALARAFVRGRLRMSCGGVLDFGPLTAGKARRQSCTLTNVGAAPLTLTGALYQAQKGAKGAFSWLAPTFPLLLKPQAEAKVWVRFAPQHNSKVGDVYEGRFAFASDLIVLPGEEAPSLEVKGVMAIPKMKLEIRIPLQCQTNLDCTWLDPRLVCPPRDSGGLQAARSCVAPEETPLYKVPFSGRSVEQGVYVRVRSVGNAPLVLQQPTMTTKLGKDFFLLPQRAPGDPMRPRVFPTILAPKHSLLVELRYQRSSDKASSALLTLETNDPLRPVVRVPLLADAAKCQLRFERKSGAEKVYTLQFHEGYHSSQRPSQLSGAWVNVGGAPCTITSSSVLQSSPPPDPASGAAFRLNTKVKFPLLLRHGESLAQRLEFAPNTKEKVFEGKWQLVVETPAQKTVSMSVRGLVAQGCLVLSKGSLVREGAGFCDNVIHTLTLSNRGGKSCEDFAITDLFFSGKHYLVARSSPTTPQFPFALKPDKPLEITLVYAPVGDAPIDGELVIQTIAPKDNATTAAGVAKVTKVSMASVGGAHGQQKDTHTQVLLPKSDILFVFDNSPEMRHDIAHVSNQLSSWAATLRSLRNDWQAAIISTDVSGKRFTPGCPPGGGSFLNRNSVDIKGALRGAISASGMVGPPPQGLAAITAAIGQAKAGACLGGFFRKDSKVVLVVVTVHDDHSPGSENTYLKAINDARTKLGWKDYQLVVVGGPVPDGCQVAGRPKIKAGTRYKKLTFQTTGVFDSFCASPWRLWVPYRNENNFLPRTFDLSRRPAPETLRVFLDGKEKLPEDLGHGWRYERFLRAIQFKGTFPPNPGGKIEVTYQLTCPEDWPK